MTERDEDRRDATYVPPPYPQKPKSSRDNAVELAAGSKAEQDVLTDRENRLAARGDVPQQPAGRPVSRETLAEERAASDVVGQLDSAEGTGVGYAGEGGASYGTQGATGASDRLEDAPETAGRRAEMHSGDTRRSIDTERATHDYPEQEQEEIQQTAQSSPPAQDRGDTGRPEPVDGKGVIGGSKDEPPDEAGARALEESQGHVEPTALDSATKQGGN